MIRAPIRLSASAVIRRSIDNRFLLVEELVNHRLVLDVPGGTWEIGETLIETSLREAAEEASVIFTPEYFLGSFTTEFMSSSGKRVCNVRMGFAGSVDADPSQVPRDPSTKAIHWLDLEEIKSNQDRLRSSATLRCVQAFANGRVFPLDFCDQAADWTLNSAP